MSHYVVEIKNSAKGDLKKLKQSHLKNQFLEVIADLKEDPYQLTQSVERLQPASAGRYSRRLNSQHRVVYTVDDEKRIVSIYAAWSRHE